MPGTVIVSVSPRDQKNSARRKEVRRLLAGAGRKDMSCKEVSALYKLEGQTAQIQIEKIAQELLCDPIVEKFAIDGKPQDPQTFFVDVWPKPGVADPVGESVLKAVRDLGIQDVSRVSSGTRYEFSAKSGSLNGKLGVAASEFASRELLNPLIQECKIIKL